MVPLNFTFQTEILIFSYLKALSYPHRFLSVNLFWYLFLFVLNGIADQHNKLLFFKHSIIPLRKYNNFKRWYKWAKMDKKLAAYYLSSFKYKKIHLLFGGICDLSKWSKRNKWENSLRSVTQSRIRIVITKPEDRADVKLDLPHFTNVSGMVNWNARVTVSCTLSIIIVYKLQDFKYKIFRNMNLHIITTGTID